jgi:uncharacterized membrane protein
MVDRSAPDEAGEGKGRPEHRWPAVAAIVVALLAYALLPSSFLLPVRYFVVFACIVLLIPVLVINPVRMTKQSTWSRRLSIALTILLAVANHAAIVQLIVMLVTANGDDDGTLLLAAAQVWVTHIIVYALIFWEMDRGGPVVRTVRARKDLPDADIRFPQDENADAVIEVARGSSKRSNWTAGFVDYLYFSGSNTMAFSPPDAMALTTRAKLLALLQALVGYIILVLVVARAVSLLG